MKNFRSYMLLVLSALTALLFGGVQKASAEVNWEDFLSRHDLTWERAPKAWYEGPFTGNGMLGSTFHQLDEKSIRISIGRSDVEEHGNSNEPFLRRARLPVGYFILKTVGKINGFEGRLDLYDAEVRGRLLTDKGHIDLTSLTHSQDMVIAYDFKPSEGEAGFSIEWQSLDAIPPARKQADDEVAKKGDKASSSRVKWHKADYKYNPKPVVSKQGDYHICRQEMVMGGETGTAWIIRETEDGGKLLLASIEHSFPEKTAVKDAAAHLESVKDELFVDFTVRHRIWWHDYYPKSFLSIDDTKMEGFYWIQIYKFASGARKGRAYMDTMGPWITEDTAWANGWFDLNTQLSYWFLTTANRMEVAESLFTKMDESFDIFVANMPAKYKGEAAAISSIAPQTFISPFGERLGFMGDFTWLCHDYWLMLQRTMDEMRTKEKFYPLLTKAVNTYIFNMVEGEDGLIHLPVTRSPEYGGGVDCNYNMALFRWGTETLIHIAEKYEIDDPLLPKWRDIAKRLAPFPVDETGYMVAKDFPLDKGHRHYSHLLMFYPLQLVDVEQEGKRDLIAKSVDHWTGLYEKGNAGTGYSYSAAAAMHALQGDGEKAASYLDVFMRMDEIFPDNPTAIHGTTMYTETNRMQPVTETPFSLCDSLQQMLLQSWSGKVRVFPAVPDAWENISFSGMLAAGGFELSAVRKDGKTQFISIKSQAGEACVLASDLSEKVRIEGIPADRVKSTEEGVFEIDLRAGEEVVLFAEGVEGKASVAPVEPKLEELNSFGLK
ncbi:MAG: glycosyl hydrolase family 95 catalytic domain-containing protein [Luteolibacter sp.]